MKRIVWLVAGLMAVYGCGSDSQQDGVADSVSSTASTAGDVSNSTTSSALDESGGGDGSTFDPCSTMVVDPSDFVSETYPQLVELDRGEIEADWLRVEGAVGCLVELTEPGGEFRAVGVEGYVFDTGVASPEDLVAGRVESSVADITSATIESMPGVLALLGEDAETPYAVALESGGVGLYVQTTASDVDPTVLVAVAESIAGAEDLARPLGEMSGHTSLLEDRAADDGVSASGRCSNQGESRLTAERDPQNRTL